jgi:O-antigen/teichoic acid export membrane protein
LLNASNYLFHVAISRLLGPRDYGALTSLLALMLVLSVPLGVVQATVAKRIAVLRRSGGGDVGSAPAGAMKAIMPVGVLVLVVIAIASPIVAAFLRLDLLSIVAVGGYLGISLTLAVALGTLQGSLRFKALAACVLVGVVVRCSGRSSRSSPPLDSAAGWSASRRTPGEPSNRHCTCFEESLRALCSASGASGSSRSPTS